MQADQVAVGCSSTGEANGANEVGYGWARAHTAEHPVGGVRALTLATLFGTAEAAGATATGQRPTVATTNQMAGFLVSAGTVTSASTTFTIPRVTCDKNGTPSGVIPSMHGQNWLAGVAVQCNRGAKTPEIDLYVFVDFHRQLTPASPGDTVTATLTINASKQIASAHDITSGKSASHSCTNCTNLVGTKAVWFGSSCLAEPAMGRVGPAAFGSITFTANRANGISIKKLPAKRLNWVNGTKTVVTTSPLTPAGDFTTTRVG